MMRAILTGLHRYIFVDVPWRSARTETRKYTEGLKLETLQSDEMRLLWCFQALQNRQEWYVYASCLYAVYVTSNFDVYRNGRFAWHGLAWNKLGWYVHMWWTTVSLEFLLLRCQKQAVNCRALVTKNDMSYLHKNISLAMGVEKLELTCEMLKAKFECIKNGSIILVRRTK